MSYASDKLVYNFVSRDCLFNLIPIRGSSEEAFIVERKVKIHHPIAGKYARLPLRKSSLRTVYETRLTIDGPFPLTTLVLSVFDSLSLPVLVDSSRHSVIYARRFENYFPSLLIRNFNAKRGAIAVLRLKLSRLLFFVASFWGNGR